MAEHITGRDALAGACGRWAAVQRQHLIIRSSKVVAAAGVMGLHRPSKRNSLSRASSACSRLALHCYCPLSTPLLPAFIQPSALSVRCPATASLHTTCELSSHPVVTLY
jgi:hypothetical protein